MSQNDSGRNGNAGNTAFRAPMCDVACREGECLFANVLGSFAPVQ
jgi:hypothetical protein